MIMFNPILDSYPDRVDVNGVEYPVHTDFRLILRILAYIDDLTFSWRERQVLSLSLFFYSEHVPKDMDAAYRSMIDFIQMYRDDSEYMVKPEKPIMEPYDFQFDAQWIYSAFLQQYGIDLNTGSMHWFRFMILFEDLNDGTPTIVNLIRTRIEKPNNTNGSQYNTELNKRKMQIMTPKDQAKYRKTMEKWRRKEQKDGK